MAEINVVPYIDVMLVLLVIFMITTPLITQSVHVELPEVQANPKPSSTAEKALEITVDAAGNFYLSAKGNPREPLAEPQLAERVNSYIKENPKAPVIVRGDKGALYGQVVKAMAILQAAGVTNVGLITETIDDRK